jgi:hypothetical protein
MRPMIEPAAGRLFDIYYQYTAKEDLAALQSLTEEAYKLHERLRKLSPNNKGLFELDEFLLLKALRNYSVHSDDFIGKAYAVKRQFAEQHQLELQRVCLVDKKIVRLALNAEKPLQVGEQNKVSKISMQLVDFGEFYNIEPVIFNFMVKVYEKLISLKLTIPGVGFSEIDKSYKNEIYHNYPHYVSLQSINVKYEDILTNITPLKEINISDNKGLLTEEEDPFSEISILELDYAKQDVMNYEGGDYDAMHDAMLKKIVDDSEILEIATLAPKHLGIAFVSSNDINQPAEVTSFNISKQREAFHTNGIELDPIYYETTAYELLVLLIHDNKIFPVIIYKDSLFSLQRQSEPGPSCDQVDIDLSEFGGDKFSINVPKTQHQDFTVKPGRNDLCPCGSGNKYKKCCLY